MWRFHGDDIDVEKLDGYIDDVVNPRMACSGPIGTSFLDSFLGVERWSERIMSNHEGKTSSKSIQHVRIATLCSDHIKSDFHD